MMRVFVSGQSPRPEVEAEIAAAAPGLAIQLEGALDGMTRDEIASQRAPTPIPRSTTSWQAP